jgi:hypothetical protein
MAFEYAAPCVPEGKFDVVMARAAGVATAAATVMVTVAVAVLFDFRSPSEELESVTLTPKE